MGIIKCSTVRYLWKGLRIRNDEVVGQREFAVMFGRTLEMY